MAMSLSAAAEAFREAIRETVKRYALWYLIEGVLLIVAGIVAIIYPVIASAAVVVLLGWRLQAEQIGQSLLFGITGSTPQATSPRSSAGQRLRPRRCSNDHSLAWPCFGVCSSPGCTSTPSTRRRFAIR